MGRARHDRQLDNVKEGLALLAGRGSDAQDMQMPGLLLRNEDVGISRIY